MTTESKTKIFVAVPEWYGFRIIGAKRFEGYSFGYFDRENGFELLSISKVVMPCDSMRELADFVEQLK